MLCRRIHGIETHKPVRKPACRPPLQTISLTSAKMKQTDFTSHGRIQYALLCVSSRGRIRTYECGSQSPMPYPLATRLKLSARNSAYRRNRHQYVDYMAREVTDNRLPVTAHYPFTSTFVSARVRSVNCRENVDYFLQPNFFIQLYSDRRRACH